MGAAEARLTGRTGPPEALAFLRSGDRGLGWGSRRLSRYLGKRRSGGVDQAGSGLCQCWDSRSPIHRSLLVLERALPCHCGFLDPVYQLSPDSTHEVHLVPSSSTISDSGG